MIDLVNPCKHKRPGILLMANCLSYKINILMNFICDQGRAIISISWYLIPGGYQYGQYTTIHHEGVYQLLEYTSVYLKYRYIQV